MYTATFTFAPGDYDDEYHALDDRIYRSEIRLETLCDESLEALKKQRAQLKDRLYQQLVQPA